MPTITTITTLASAFTATPFIVSFSFASISYEEKLENIKRDKEVVAVEYEKIKAKVHLHAHTPCTPHPALAPSTHATFSHFVA